MIQIAQGNLLAADAEALVNTVNCVGFMGKGIALQFKQAFPDNFKAYQQACKKGAVQPGRMLVYHTGRFDHPRYIVNFPTKRHWRGSSRMEDIDSGLTALVDEIKRLGILSIAIPPLGCGNGGLDWLQVRPRIEKALASLPDVRVLLFEPAGAPPARMMPIRTQRPKLTTARALFIKLMDRYGALYDRLTLLEIQKLAYFLQEAGQPLRLDYEKGHYGPYATNLNKVLERLEGHFTRGYGDSQRPDVDIDLLPHASLEAEDFLRGCESELGRLERVSALIEGFETPYGMELLSSAHWVAMKQAPKATTADQAVAAIHAWNPRKRRMFNPEHIAIAWDRLSNQGWLE